MHGQRGRRGDGETRRSGDRQPRQGIGIENGQTLQGTQEDLGGVEAGLFDRPVRAGNELCLRATRDVRLENFVRVVEIGDDDGETREILLKRWMKRAVACEETGQWSGFN